MTPRVTHCDPFVTPQTSILINVYNGCDGVTPRTQTITWKFLPCRIAKQWNAVMKGDRIRAYDNLAKEQPERSNDLLFGRDIKPLG